MTTSRASAPTISGGPIGRKIGPGVRCCRVVRELCRGSRVRGSAGSPDREAGGRQSNGGQSERLVAAEYRRPPESANREPANPRPSTIQRMISHGKRWKYAFRAFFSLIFH